MGRDGVKYILPRAVNGRTAESFKFHTLFIFLSNVFIHLSLGISHHLPQNRTPSLRRVCTALKAEGGTGQLPSSTFYGTCTPMPVRTKTILGRIWGMENEIFSWNMILFFQFWETPRDKKFFLFSLNFTI